MIVGKKLVSLMKKSEGKSEQTKQTQKWLDFVHIELSMEYGVHILLGNILEGNIPGE